MKMSIDHSVVAKFKKQMVRRTLHGSTMGTRYSAVFYAPPLANVAELEAALFEAVDRVDRQMSTWNPDSDLNRLNAAPTGRWIDLPHELMTVLAAALQVERSSHGAFDINVGSIVSAWGFGPAAREGGHHAFANSSMAAHHAASKALELISGEGRALKTMPVALDLSGIAKGYGVDELARVMDEFRISSWLVGIDGEMRAKGMKPDGTMWAVAHERPDRHVREAMGVIELQDIAVATSGNYRHVVEIDGKAHSHTIDPHTAMPLENNVASITVLAPSCMEADAWATALMVMGAQKALSVGRTRGFDVVCVLQDGSVCSTL